MAKILATPGSGRGLLSLTSVEVSRITSEDLVLLRSLEADWAVVCHPNYFDFNFQSRNFIDGYLAHRTIFRTSQANDPIFEINCLNFVPTIFHSALGSAIYDFCHVTRLAPNKGTQELIDVVAQSLSAIPDLTGVIVVSVPGMRPHAADKFRRWVNSKIPRRYRNQLDLVTLDYNLPYPHSRRFVASLYRASKIHLNLNPHEKHGRAQAYALASGMPIVGMPNLSELVHPPFRAAPHYFLATEKRLFSTKIGEALESCRSSRDSTEREAFAQAWRSTNALSTLGPRVANLGVTDPHWFGDPEDWIHSLAKHHLPATNTNSYGMPLTHFLRYLVDGVQKLPQLEAPSENEEELTIQALSWSGSVGHLQWKHRFGIWLAQRRRGFDPLRPLKVLKSKLQAKKRYETFTRS